MAKVAMSALEKYEIDLLIRQERHYRDMQRWSELRKMWHPDASQTLVSISLYVLKLSIVLQQLNILLA